MEPERKIEKLLRAYAKKRKGQAGEPFDLHPATRRLLHGEIARNTTKGEGKDDESTSLWEVFRRDWAFLLGFALCIFLVAAVFFHGLTSKHTTQTTAAPGNLAQFSKDSLGMLSTNELPQQKTLTGSLANAGRSEIVNNKNFYRLTTNTMPPTLAFNTPPAPQPAAIPQPATSAPADISEAASPPGAPPPPEVASTAPASMPPAFADDAEVSTLSGRETVHAASHQKLSLPQNRFKNTSATRHVPVLTKFQVQQNGNTIRIVDHDGSVYEGMLFRGTPGVATATLRTRAEPEGAFPGGTNTNAVMAVTGSVAGAAPQEKSPSAQSYFFMVHGMNHTLKQNVVFTGSFKLNLAEAKTKVPPQTGLPEAAQIDAAYADRLGPVGGYGGGSGGGGAGGRNQWASTNQFAQFPWSNLLIKGTAIINHTNHIPINATPMTSSNN